MEKHTMTGILYGVGVGPGDPELITCKAVRIMRQSDILLIPAKTEQACISYGIARAACPELARKEKLCLPFPMSKDAGVIAAAHDAVCEKVKGLLTEGKQAAFLTLGDPCIYATYHYLHRRIREAGGRAEVINGVPSFCAAAGVLGISLGEGGEQIHIIPASYEIEDSLALPGTKIYMKSGKKLEQLKEFLQKSGRKEKLEVYSVENCGMIGEKITRGIEGLSSASGYLTTVIVKEKGEA